MATAPLQLPDLAFEDADGKPKKLSDWRGKTVLVNLWATWCVPCRKEMPALDGLQTKLGGPNFEVVAINIDTRDPEKPKNFLKEANLTRLGYFSDQKAKVFQDLKAIGRALGMPTSVLVDGQGCEIATIAGPAEWDSDDAIKLITGGGAAGGGGLLGVVEQAIVEIAADAGGRHWPRRGVLLAAPSRVRTADFSASAFDFRIVVATCICVFARLHGEKAADQCSSYPYAYSPSRANLSGRG